MFWQRFANFFKPVPAQWQKPLAHVSRLVQQLPAGAVADPAIVAHRANLSLAESVALLGVLQERGRGRLAFRVVQDGVEFSAERFTSKKAIPPIVTNEFGDELRVFPENVELIFDPALT